MWLREHRTEHHRLSELIYWDCLEDAPGVVLQKDNSLLAVCASGGRTSTRRSPPSSIAYAMRLNNVFRRFGGGWAIFSEAQRREVCTYPEATWPDPVSALVDGERRRFFLTPGRHYETSTYLTLVYAKPRERVSQWRQWLYANLPETQPDAYTLTYFQEEVLRVLDLLRDCCPEAELLIAEETRPGYSPLLTYLHSTVSPKVHPVGLPAETGYLDSGLTDTDMYTGLYPSWGDPDDPLTFQGYLAAISVRRYPEATYPGILDTLNTLPDGVPLGDPLSAPRHRGRGAGDLQVPAQMVGGEQTHQYPAGRARQCPAEPAGGASAARIHGRSQRGAGAGGARRGELWLYQQHDRALGQRF